MAANQYIGVNGVARRVKSQTIGVSGVARKIKTAWIGVAGVARKCYQGVQTVTVAKSAVTPSSTGVMMFGKTVPQFQKVTGWIRIPEKAYAYGSGNTVVVPYGAGIEGGDDEENPYYFSVTSANGESASREYEYSNFDGEYVSQVTLCLTIKRDRIEATLRIYYDVDGNWHTAFVPINGATDFSLTFTYEG